MSNNTTVSGDNQQDISLITEDEREPKDAPSAESKNPEPARNPTPISSPSSAPPSHSDYRDTIPAGMYIMYALRPIPLVKKDDTGKIVYHSPMTKALLMNLAYFSSTLEGREGQRISPSKEDIARGMGTESRTVRRHMNILKELGWVREIGHRYSKNVKMPVYNINMNMLSRCLDVEETSSALSLCMHGDKNIILGMYYAAQVPDEKDWDNLQWTKDYSPKVLDLSSGISPALWNSGENSDEELNTHTGEDFIVIVPPMVEQAPVVDSTEDAEQSIFSFFTRKKKKSN